MSKCKFCGSSSYGAGSRSPHKKHEHLEDEKHCVYCGSSSYGHAPTVHLRNINMAAGTINAFTVVRFKWVMF